MDGIEMKNGLLIYYGNPAGYLKENEATVDTMFKSKEFEEWLSEKKFISNWTEGVFERLSKGEKLGDVMVKLFCNTKYGFLSQISRLERC